VEVVEMIDEEELEDEEVEDKINKEVVIITKGEEDSTIEEVDRTLEVDITITETDRETFKTNLKDRCKVAQIKPITKLLCADILIFVSSKTRF
jgi:hypothetical protein